MIFMWAFFMSKGRDHHMLTYIFCLLFTLNGTFSYGLENTVDETLQRTNQQAFFANQDSCLQKAAKEHSVVYEVRQQLLHKGIQRLQPSKLDIQIGGGELSESEMVNMFNKEKKKFINEMANDFDENVANTLILINLRAKAKLSDGTISEPQKLSYFTTPDVFLSCENLADYSNQLSILNQWSYYSDFTIAVIPKGARLQAMIGLTAAQESIPSQRDEIVKEVGEEKAHYYTPKLGGAPQIYIAHASEYHLYDMGPISTKDFKKIPVRDVQTNQYSIHLPVLEFLNVKLNNSFEKVHATMNTIYKSPYYINPFSMFFSEINIFQKLFHYSTRKQKKNIRGVNTIPLLVKSYPNTKPIIPYKKRQQSILVRCLFLTNVHVPYASLSRAYIAPFISHAIKILR